MSNKKQCDVIIIGGGPAGATQACALAMHGLKVIVVDQLAPEVTMQANFDGRTTAIAYGSSNIYRGIDVWPLFEPFAEPILDIRVSDHNSHSFMHYDHANLEWIAPAKVVSFERHENAAVVILDNGTTLQGKLLIAADGRNSQMREIVGIPLTKWSYHQNAIVCMIEHELPHEGVAHEHFLPTGPFAVLPMQGNRSSVVWSMREELSPAMMDLTPAEFATAMQEKFGDSLGKLTLSSQRWCYPLGVQFASTYIDKRFAMIGDAAHVIHPIAGQGLNMGLRDVAALTESLVEAHRLGLDIGGHTTLDRYQRWRRFDNMSLIAVTDSLTRLFSNDIRPLKFLRDSGLGLMNNIGPAKKFLMKHAVGMVGNLPKLVAGERL
jgi:2-octaprenyl-6-methoxyphenol hydroxylase